MFSPAYCFRNKCGKQVQANELVVFKALIGHKVMKVGTCSEACKRKVLTNK